MWQLVKRPSFSSCRPPPPENWGRGVTAPHSPAYFLEQLGCWSRVWSGHLRDSPGDNAEGLFKINFRVKPS